MATMMSDILVLGLKWGLRPSLLRIKIERSLLSVPLFDLERILVVPDLVLRQQVVEAVSILSVQFWVYVL